MQVKHYKSLRIIGIYTFKWSKYVFSKMVFFPSPYINESKMNCERRMYSYLKLFNIFNIQLHIYIKNVKMYKCISVMLKGDCSLAIKILIQEWSKLKIEILLVFIM